jgi:Bacteriophage T4, Gp8
MANNFSNISRRLGYERAFTFYDSFVTTANDAAVGYIMLGRSLPWDANDTPPAIYDTENTLFDTYNNFLGGKKITGNDVFPVIPRRNWVANTVWTQYDDDSNTQFSAANSMFVCASGGNVYKCLNNANGAYSTIEPANNYTSANGFTSPGDGYTWKYMYKVPSTSKFLTSAWMPVPLSQTGAYFGFANNLLAGAISRVVLTTGGNGYSNTNTVIQVTGSGAGANVTANVNAAGNVQSITLNARGSGYLRSNTRARVVGSGANATVRVVLSPYGGHGFNPARELGANSVMVSIKIGDVDSTEGGTVTSNNDFRQIGLLMRPHKYGEDAAVATANANIAVRMVTQIVLTSGSSYLKDEVVYQGSNVAYSTFSANVSDVFTNAIEATHRRGTIIPGALLIGNTSGISRTVVATTDPDLDEESGDLVYTENRSAVTRTDGQAEWVKIVLNFMWAIICCIGIT